MSSGCGGAYLGDKKTGVGFAPIFTKQAYTSNKSSWQDAENLDATHGYISYIWIPEEVAQVTLLKVKVYAEKFRTHSTTAASGGADTSGASGAHRHLMFVYDSTVAAIGSAAKLECQSGAGFIYETINSNIAEDVYTYESVANHTHTTPNHTHPITYGIYEEAIVGRTLSAALYSPAAALLHNFGVVCTGESNAEIDCSPYMTTLTSGVYELRLTASSRLRARVVYFEMSKLFSLF